MTLPSSIPVLIVGAGPSGLSVALSLLNEGIKPEDILLVDALEKGENISRAIVVHAATLESLDTLKCADDLISLGIKAKAVQVRSKRSEFLTASLDSLNAYTKFPYALCVSQTRTEEVLNMHLEKAGLLVRRPYQVVGISSSDEGINVRFENGEVVQAKYVIGADGSKSVIRTLNDITFKDPDGMPHEESVNPNIAQLVLADVTFTDPGLPYPREQVTAFGSQNGLFFCIPMNDFDEQGSQRVLWKIGFNIPLSKGPPPSNPSLAYIQEHVDLNGPPELSSDPKKNPRMIKVKSVVWATRFRTHAAIADTFFKKVDSGIVFLVGDAAHIHSPAGGQGMNLGIRDAVALGPVIANHLKSSSFEDIKLIEEFAAARQKRALTTIRLTKRFMTVASTLTSTSIVPLPYIVFGILSRLTFVKNMMVWRLSGLGNR